MLKRILCMLVCLLMLLPALAEDAGDGAFPPLNADGFLEEGEFVHIDEGAGVWRYASPDLKVEVLRHTAKNAKGSNLTWYEAEVWSRNGVNWGLVTYEDGKHMSGGAAPYKVAQRNKSVLAINTDYAQARYPAKDNTVGIIIRDGRVYSDKTLKSTSKRWPPLDVLALYPDGRMEVYTSDEHSAQEYLDMGVQTTLAFGPYLIRDGVRNDADISTMNQGNNPRTAIGMVEPGHTFAMMLEGRHKGSVGAHLDFLADRMVEKGCTLAFNLDGGQTSCMMFMGKQINLVYGSSGKPINGRSTTELLSIGQSDLVPPSGK